MDKRIADRRTSLVSEPVAGWSGRRRLNRRTASRLAVPALRFGSASRLPGCEALRSFFRPPETIRGAPGIPKSSGPEPCPGCSKGRGLRRVGRETSCPAPSSRERMLRGDRCSLYSCGAVLDSSRGSPAGVARGGTGALSGLRRVCRWHLGKSASAPWGSEAAPERLYSPLLAHCTPGVVMVAAARQPCLECRIENGFYSGATAVDAGCLYV